MPSIGDTLREARMRQRLDIGDVEERTKIRAKYLRALENEEFGLLPGSTFVKTFLRTYAEALGLDPHVLVEEYRQSFESGDEMEAPLGPPAAGGRERDRRYGGGVPPRGTIAAIAVVVVIGFLLVLGLTGNNNDNASKQAGQTTTETQKKRPRKKPQPAAGVVRLEITPDGPTYMCVDRGPGAAVLYNSTTTDPQTFKGKKLRLNLGRTAVTIKVNGKPFPVKQAPNPVGYEFSPTGSRELPEGKRPTCA